MWCGSPRSGVSCRRCGCGGERQQLRVLVLLPAQPLRRRNVLGTGRLGLEPGVDGCGQLLVAAQPHREADVSESDVEARDQLAQRSQALQLTGAVEPVAGLRALRLDEPGALDVAQP